jgi:hypothetical protein
MNLWSDWKKLKVPFIPNGKSGNWTVEELTVSQHDADFSKLRASIQPREAGREVLAGKYKALKKNGHLVMSDTRAEILDHAELLYNRKGSVLLHGLGLGMAANACLMSEDLAHLTIVEISEDVIKLIGPALRRRHYKAYKAGRIEIIQGDALTWKPPRGAKWDFVWHDIWNDLCLDNRKTMSTLHRRFARRASQQDSWGRDWIAANARF